MLHVREGAPGDTPGHVAVPLVAARVIDIPIPNTRAVPAAFLIKVRRVRLAVGVDVMGCGLLGSVFIGGFLFWWFDSKLFGVGPRRAAPRKRA